MTIPNHHSLAGNTPDTDHQSDKTHAVPAAFEDNDVGTGQLNLRFLDEGTGYAVIPISIRITHRNDQSRNRTYSQSEVAITGSLVATVYGGTVDVVVQAVGYEPMASFFTVEGQTLNVNFNLVPLTPAPETTSSAIARLQRPNATVLVGFLVDDQTGQPMQGVAIATLDGSATVKTDARGFFALSVSLPTDATDLTRRNTVRFAKAGYVEESYSNFDMWPNGDVVLQVRLRKGSGLNHVNVLPNRGATIVVIN